MDLYAKKKEEAELFMYTRLLFVSQSNKTLDILFLE